MDLRRLGTTLIYFLVILGVFYFVQDRVVTDEREVTYGELVQAVNAGRVDKAWIGPDRVEAEVRPADSEVPDGDDATQAKTAEEGESEPEVETWVADRVPGLDPNELVDALTESGAELAGRPASEPWWIALIWIAPFLLLMLPYLFFMRAMRKGGGPGGGGMGPMSFGRNKAKLYDESSRIKVGFDDVAGVDESKEELQEVVDFLKAPKKYEEIGAQIPKGVLLVGPPGTGKTLLARAVAGEAKTAFFSISASSFVEMFVGVGAARVRDLFEQAKGRAPCIIFIDEIDAIGRSRGGVGAMGTHDEREQTLNQLLAELDGFEPNSGVVIMAATNRPEVLDPALTRAGRFDRQVVVDRPDVRAREAILRVHVRGVKLGDDVDLRVVAQRTPGMVGADMARVVNEAALAAARRGAEIVEQVDFEEAVDRIQLGLKKRGRAMNETEKARVAYHESGHALVALAMEHADPVHRVSIIPRSVGSLGVTLQLPTEERHLMTRQELLDRIAVMMGGRVAEELACHDISTGAQNDLERATETARQMVCRFGMSERLGAQTFGKPAGMRFLDTPVNLGEERNFSDRRAEEIDDEVTHLLVGALDRARHALGRRRAALEAMTRRLVEEETLDRSQIDEVLEEYPEGTDLEEAQPVAS
jgi:cell division protease FtsH